MIRKWWRRFLSLFQRETEEKQRITLTPYGSDRVERVELACGGYVTIPVSDVAESMEEYRHDPNLTHVNTRALLQDGS